MEYIIASTIVVLIIFIVLSNEHKTQKELEERIELLKSQKFDLRVIIDFLLDEKFVKNLSDKIKEDINDLMTDVSTGYSNMEQITEKLDIMCRRLNAIKKNNEEDDIDEMFREDNDDLFNNL